MTQETPHRPPVRKVVLATLDEYGSIDDDLLVAVTHAETDGVIRAWGFEHKSQAVWDKGHVGVGYWFRGQHELLYVATRGDVSPRVAT